MKEKALVVLSGGQDSTTCLFWAKQRYKEVHAITFNYGQRHYIELKAAKTVAEMAGVTTHELVDVPNCLVSISPLVADTELHKYGSHEQMVREVEAQRESTFVPMRNALFLTIAANRAEALGNCDIVTGVCQMDNANYDDCRQTFVTATEQYINTALGNDHRGTYWINVVTPLMWLSKAQTVDLALSMSQDDWDLAALDGTAKPVTCWDTLAYSHTSYDGKYPPTDMNHANVLRAQGFLDAGKPDPLVLRACKEGLMEYPTTSNYDAYNGSDH